MPPKRGYWESSISLVVGFQAIKNAYKYVMNEINDFFVLLKMILTR